MLMGMFGQPVLGLCTSHSACCRTTVGGKLNEGLDTRLTPNYVYNQLSETCCCAKQI
jgi:hypothetical protein